MILPKTSFTAPAKNRTKKLLLLGLSLVLLCGMMIIMVVVKFPLLRATIGKQWGKPPPPTPVVTEEPRDVVTDLTGTPVEDPPGPTYKWKGRATDPKYIKLPTVGVEAYVQAVGIDKNQQIAVPNNIHVAGWFVESARPGENGLSIIDGHVDGTSVGGVFRKLVQLKQDDQFTIEFGNGTVKTFKVIRVTAVDLNKAADVLFSQDSKIKSQLNLITCGGTYDKKNKTYNQRIIVEASFVEGL